MSFMASVNRKSFDPLEQCRKAAENTRVRCTYSDDVAAEKRCSSLAIRMMCSKPLGVRFGVHPHSRNPVHKRFPELLSRNLPTAARRLSRGLTT